MPRSSGPAPFVARRSLVASTALHAGAIGALAVVLGNAATAGWRSLRQPSRPSAITFAEATPPVAEPPLPAPEIVVEAVAPEIVEMRALAPDAPTLPPDPVVCREPSRESPPAIVWFAAVSQRAAAKPPPPAAAEQVPPDAPAAAPASDGAMVEPSPLASENAPPRYPFVAWRRGIEGAVVVELGIDREGVVTAARVVQSSGNRSLDEAARDRLATWRFAPARNPLGPVACTQRQTVVFRLRDRQVSVGAAAH